LHEEFEQLNGDLVVDDGIAAFAQSHPTLLERAQLFLGDGYRPSVRESIGRPESNTQEELDAAQREEQKRTRWWVAGQEPGPFAGHQATVDRSTETPEDPNDDPDPDDGPITFNSPFTRKLSRREELRAIQAEDRPESPYAKGSQNRGHTGQSPLMR
jgi:hypothetical protein